TSSAEASLIARLVRPTSMPSASAFSLAPAPAGNTSSSASNACASRLGLAEALLRRAEALVRAAEALAREAIGFMVAIVPFFVGLSLPPVRRRPAGGRRSPGALLHCARWQIPILQQA